MSAVRLTTPGANAATSSAIAAQSSSFVAYAERTKAQPVHPLLTNALHYARAVGLTGPGCAALELGPGAGNESLCLAEKGWTVTAVESDTQLVHWLEERVRGAGQSSRMSVVEDSFATMRLPRGSFDLIYIACALHYLSPAEFPRAWAQIKDSLKPGGVLAIRLLGDRDSWAKTAGGTYPSSAKVREMLAADFTDIRLVSEQTTAGGSLFNGHKTWHFLEFTARRREDRS